MEIKSVTYACVAPRTLPHAAAAASGAVGAADDSDDAAARRRQYANYRRIFAPNGAEGIGAAQDDVEQYAYDCMDVIKDGSSRVPQMLALLQPERSSQALTDALAMFDPDADKFKAFLETVLKVALLMSQTPVVQGVSIVCNGAKAIAALRSHRVIEVGPASDLVGAFIQAGGLIASAFGAPSGWAPIGALLVETTKGAVLLCGHPEHPDKLLRS
jgi:hypothetical protein